ncbi:hypothetical protein I551_3863 [Mycobacterium ulcerans str. Harvey]|uniref:Uncharacterized protein n=1 Tax=Mycobacterium ulcerans str. Harvey TaxID=1299332 RepID=A0ABP3AJ44_MYCUL|nr:hypothetical protein I551_3863 [Mycobacterium ulcerans str. Harvey]
MVLAISVVAVWTPLMAFSIVDTESVGKVALLSADHGSEPRALEMPESEMSGNDGNCHAPISAAASLMPC